MIDNAFLTTLTETPSVGTACLPVLNLLASRFGDGYTRTFAPDGFCLFQKSSGQPEDLRAVFIAHVDEIGGCLYGKRPDGGYDARFWGADPLLFVDSPLQAFDYLAEDASETVPVRAYLTGSIPEYRLAVAGDGLRPYRTVFTFRADTEIADDDLLAKAVDPRMTAYAVMEAVRELDDPRVGALFVLAEECAMDVARKAVTFLNRRAPELGLIVNADVPSLANLGDAQLDMPAVRVFEGRNFIDPSFGIRTVDKLLAQGVKTHLSAARSGSQTLLFTPLAPTLSVALPGENIHSPRGRMSLTGTERCIDLLKAIGANFLEGKI
jgi:putative aminopeptidase FrvX